MGGKLIQAGIFLVMLFGVGIWLLISAKRKKSLTRLVISLLILLFIALIFFTNTIDEKTMSKSDVVSDLKHIKIELEDDFKITQNEVTGSIDRIQETEILVSKKDKERIINEIRASANIRKNNFGGGEQFGVIQNFQYPEFYSRSLYSYIDNYPTRLWIKVEDNNDTIKYTRYEDD